MVVCGVWMRGGRGVEEGEGRREEKGGEGVVVWNIFVTVIVSNVVCFPDLELPNTSEIGEVFQRFQKAF